MVSALGQNGRYNRYISAFLERLLRVTDELIEMAQYDVVSPKHPTRLSAYRNRRNSSVEFSHLNFSSQCWHFGGFTTQGN